MPLNGKWGCWETAVCLRYILWRIGITAIYCGQTLFPDSPPLFHADLTHSLRGCIMRIFYLGNPKYTAIRTNTIPSVIRIIDHPLCFLRDNPMTIKNNPSSIDAIIAKNPILFTPFKLNHSIMTIGYFQIMSDSNNSSVKFFVHFKKQGYNSFSVLHIQRRRRLIS